MVAVAQSLLAWPVPDAVQHYDARDAILYALSVGAGTDPLDPLDLSFTWENGLRTLPTFAFVVGTPGGWFADPRTGIDFEKLVNAGVSARFRQPLPPEGVVVGRSRVEAVVDKGTERGALMIVRRVLADKGSGAPLAEIDTTYLLRGDGGCGSAGVPPKPPPPMPARAEDATMSMATPPHAALLYRLNGDLNPLHVDPAGARRAGFPRPILHGLCTLGIAGYLLVRDAAAGDPSRLASLDARFAGPLYPGETLALKVWREGPVMRFAGRAFERDAPVLAHGIAELHP